MKKTRSQSHSRSGRSLGLHSLIILEYYTLSRPSVHSVSDSKSHSTIFHQIINCCNKCCGFSYRLQDVLNNLKQKLAKQEKQYR